jgi:hypothetical protein
MKKILLYSIYTVFTIVGIFIICVSDNKKGIWVGIVLSLFFGAGGVCTYILERGGNKKIENKNEIIIIEQRGKIIAVMTLCFVFVVLGYSLLPFNHLFDGTRGYTPTLGYIVGIVAILFFGLGFVISIKRLIKPGIVMQISDKGLYVADGMKKQIHIDWQNIRGVSKSDLIFFVHYEHPRNKNKTKSAQIPISSINHYSIEQIESIIVNRINENVSI